MSILSASSAFTLNARSQGLFSSHTAFKKPTFNATLNKSSNDFTRLVTSAHPKDLANNQPKAAKLCSKSEDTELLMCDPVKKVKLGKGETLWSESINNKTLQNTVRSSRLTIEEVFSTPFDRKQNRKGSLIEDCFDEGSSLSFISSHSSFDNLDDESLTSRKNSECIIIGAEKMISNTDQQQSLVVKDDIMGRLSYLNQEPMLFNNWENHSVFFGQGDLYQPAAGYLKTLPVDVSNTSGLGCNGPLCMPPLNEYIQFTMQNQQVGMSLSDKVINELVKNSVEDGYDSDSYATRSTSIEQESVEKGASPTYSGNEDLYLERKVKQTDNQKNDKVRKQGRSRATNSKEKKGRSLNLKLDLNPKQIKVQRRLNRLQLLRYQQGTVEEDHEYLQHFGISDLLSRGNSTIQESDSNEDDDYVEDNFDPEYAKATVPELGEENPRKKRVKLMPSWNPENLEEEKFEDYIKQLGELLESPVNDIEAAIKLLNSHDSNISRALEAVKENVVFYSEVFRLKVKRLRRRGA